MIEWLAIVVLIVLGLLFLQIEHHVRRYKIIAMVLIALLIYVSISHIFSSEQVDLTSPRGAVNAVYLYFGWLGQTASKFFDIGVDTTHMVGNAIKIDNVTKDDKSKR